MKIESHDSDIESLLDSGYFHIPRFQRPYSWEDENITDFWDDIISNQTSDYFIGSMVVFRKGKQHYGVVDGQQRLTTITILLCVLRDKFSDLSENNLAKGIHQLIERKDRSNSWEYVLKTETSFPYFQEHIQKFSGDAEVIGKDIPEEDNLKAAHQRFQKLVNDAIDSVDIDTSVPILSKNKVRIDKLTSLRDSVFNLKVIFITLDCEDDAYIIFETLNTRGKDLALTDLVKNHFSKHLKASGEVDVAKIKWQELLKTTHNSSEVISTDNFIYHFWASRYEAIPQKKLFPKFKKNVTKSKAKQHLDDLINDSKLYRSLFEPSYGWNKNHKVVSRSLEAMQLFKLSQPIPATLALVKAYKDKLIRYGKLKDALWDIEKFHFQFTAVTSSRSSGGISAMYSSFAQKLFASENSQQAAVAIKNLKVKLQARVPSFDEFIVAFREINYTNVNSKQKNLVRYILRKFSEYEKLGFNVDFDELTVEHIHPQSKIDTMWTNEVVGSIGNLMCLDSVTNTKLNTKDFSKKKIYLDTQNY